MSHTRRLVLAPLLGFILLALAACGGSGGSGSTEQKTGAPSTAAGGGSAEDGGQPEATPPGTSEVAAVKGPSIAVYPGPGEGAPSMRLSNPNEDGAARVFLVAAKQKDWVHVLLPVRPNGTKGWVRASDVSISHHDFRVRIELNGHRVTVWKGQQVIDEEPVGVGRGNTPTPGGEYYITELLQPPNPSGPYGPYAYGLSGYSDVLKSFAGANGVIGLHGTNDPAGLGNDVSHGCIRMSNAGITKLVKTGLPLGTPVTIVA